MALWTIPDAAIGPVVAAVIAAFVGFVGLVIAKENKTSEFRQAWIDALRADIGAVIANINAIRGASVAEFRSKSELFAATQGHFVEANQAATSVRLRLNANEPECMFILKLLDELEDLMDSQPIDIPKCQKCEAELIKSAHVLLKKEWLRVRRGEITFVRAKAAGLIVATAMIAWLAYTWVSSSRTQTVTVTQPTAVSTPSTVSKSALPE